MLTLTPDSLFAHRGLHDDNMPKNSLSAIVAAADAGYGIEFDVHLSSDGVPIVSHDADTLADTGVELVIADTHSDTLRSLTFTTNGERLATLDDVLREVGVRVPLLIELKPTRRVAPTATAVLARVQGREDSVALQSFQPRLVQALKRTARGFAVGQLGEASNAEMPLHERLYWQTLVTNAWTRPDFLAMYLSCLDSPVVRFWRGRLGCPLLGWTVVDAAGIESCQRARAGMIFEQVRP